jgi:LPXTG-motif cell wall-anchored protein
MSGAVLDLGFTLKEETSVGDSYDLKLAVTSLKDGTTDLTGDSNVNITVKEESIKTIAYEDETETETQTETQAQTQVQTETQAQTQSTDLQTAAKTGDNTNLIVWVILMVAAAGCIVVFVVKKQKQK